MTDHHPTDQPAPDQQPPDRPEQPAKDPVPESASTPKPPTPATPGPSRPNSNAVDLTDDVPDDQVEQVLTEAAAAAGILSEQIGAPESSMSAMISRVDLGTDHDFASLDTQMDRVDYLTESTKDQLGVDADNEPQSQSASPHFRRESTGAEPAPTREPQPGEPADPASTQPAPRSAGTSDAVPDFMAEFMDHSEDHSTAGGASACLIDSDVKPKVGAVTMSPVHPTVRAESAPVKTAKQATAPNSATPSKATAPTLGRSTITELPWLVMDWIDGPFQGIPAKVKQILGWAAIALISLAAAIHFLG